MNGLLIWGVTSQARLLHDLWLTSRGHDAMKVILHSPQAALPSFPNALEVSKNKADFCHFFCRACPTLLWPLVPNMVRQGWTFTPN